MRYRDIILARALGKGKRGMAVGWPLMLGIAGGGGGTETTVTGVSPLLLEAAIKAKIKSLTQYGLCTQADTPTPSAPVPIMCNNGELRMLNLADMKEDNIVVGKYINNNGNETSAPSNFYYSPFIPVKASTAYTLKTSRSLNYANFMEYDASKGFLQRTLYGSADTPAGAVTTHTTRADTAYIRFGSNINGQTLTANAVLAIEWMFTEGATPMDYVPNGQLSVVGDNEVLWIDDGNRFPPNAVADVLYPVSGSGSCIVSCDVNNGSNVLAVEVHYYKADRTQINYYTLSSYDDATHRMYKSFSLPSTAAYVSVERKSGYSTATVTDLKLAMGATLTPYVTPQTASVPDLFAVGDYADEVEIISGGVKRKVGVWALTGEESWTVASSNSDVYYLSSANLPDDYGIAARFTPICSHLEGVMSTVSISAMTANTIKTNNSSKIVYACVGATYTTKEAWKAFVAEQYAAGTPIIILYPLAEETTESVTPQPLSTTAGDNTITATANVSPIQLEATYMKGA